MFLGFPLLAKRMAQLDTCIEFLKGVGPQRAEMLKSEVQIFTFNDLLHHFPFRYVDRSQFFSISEIQGDMPAIQIIGKIGKVSEAGVGRKKRLNAEFYDENGSMDLVWFKGIKWVKPMLKPGLDVVVFGKPTLYKQRWNIAHPEIELLSKARATKGSPLQPVYNTTEKLSARGVNAKGFEKLILNLLIGLGDKIPETLDEEFKAKYGLIARSEAIRQIHFPKSVQDLQRAKFRLKFEELFFIQMQLIRMKLYRDHTVKSFTFSKVGDFFHTFYTDFLPFELTGAQKRVIKEIRGDFGVGTQMNRLLQGDVGSGKTMVALLSMLIALDNGYQAALIAPTEILAKQHFEGISEQLKHMPVKVELLTGSTKQSQRKVLFEELKTGVINILIGTHALLEEKVQFENLGFVVIDEQHRFGVAQRSKMWKKNERPPHVLVMSATPIPRTLAMTLYGDLDVSVIDELPPGRKPIDTKHMYDNQRLRVFEFMRQEIEKGRQVYLVYPLIEESETLDYKDLTDGYESISRAFPKPKYQISIVHGRQKADEKDYEMRRFARNETQILVATTVIEVGVNVPNASVMVIESAERFGLSQLHQLRGRVGRGAEQSFCILMTSVKLSADARTRMETMVRTNDGFEVAEVDLKLRGPGDIMGTQQSGMLNLKIADLARDTEILKIARLAAIELLKQDPNLASPQNARIKLNYQKFVKGRRDWSKIS